MSKTAIALIVTGAIVTALALFLDTRIAAGVGALALLGALIFGYVSNKRAPDSTFEQAERNARRS